MTHVKLNKSFDEKNLEQKQGVIRFIEDFKNDPAIKHMRVNGNIAFKIEEGDLIGRKVLRDYLIENKLEDREAVYNHLVKKLSESLEWYKSEDPQIPEILAEIGDIHSASLKDISDVVERYAGGLTPRYRNLMNHFKGLKNGDFEESINLSKKRPYADELKRLESLIGKEFSDPQMLEDYLYENEDEYPLLTKLARKNWDKFLDTVNPMFDTHYKEIMAREETLRNIEARKREKMHSVEEGRRPLPIMRQFKKGFEALDKAFATIPSVQKALTEFRLKVGSEDFNGDYVITVGFDKEIIDIQNVYWYLNGQKDKVKMTSKWNKEKAAAVLINDALEYDDAYLMDSPTETLLYITNATPTNEYMLESKNARKSLRESFIPGCKKLGADENYEFYVCDNFEALERLRDSNPHNKDLREVFNRFGSEQDFEDYKDNLTEVVILWVDGDGEIGIDLYDDVQYDKGWHFGSGEGVVPRNIIQKALKSVFEGFYESKKITKRRFTEATAEFNVGDKVRWYDPPSHSCAPGYGTVTKVKKIDSYTLYEVEWDDGDVSEEIEPMYLKPYRKPAPVHREEYYQNQWRRTEESRKR